VFLRHSVSFDILPDILYIRILTEVTTSQPKERAGNQMKRKTLLRIIKICVFFLIANLPFLTLINLFGIDTFIDTFRHPTAYQTIKTDTIPQFTTQSEYILLKKPHHQNYSIEINDILLYYTTQETFVKERVSSIVSTNGINRYYTVARNNPSSNGPIFEDQILGIIQAEYDSNLWNNLCIQLWDLSTENLNAIALFTP
jgi:hypothetical protein